MIFDETLDLTADALFVYLYVVDTRSPSPGLYRLILHNLNKVTHALSLCFDADPEASTHLGVPSTPSLPPHNVTMMRVMFSHEFVFARNLLRGHKKKTPIYIYIYILYVNSFVRPAQVVQHLSTLGVTNFLAGRAEVKAAYRGRALHLHPDRYYIP